MVCKHCEGHIEENHVFCPFCGEKVEVSVKEELKEEVVSEAKETVNEQGVPAVEEAKPEENKIENKEDEKKPGNTKLHFGTLILGITFMFAILSIAMVVQVGNDVHDLKRSLYILHKEMAHQDVVQKVEEEKGISGGEVSTVQVGRFFDGEGQTVLFNVSVPDSVLFHGVSYKALAGDEKFAFAKELMEDSWANFSEENLVCYPDLSIQLFVNDVSYASYADKTLRLAK